MKKFGQNLAGMLGILFSLGALFWLAQQFDFNELMNTLHRLDWMMLAPVPLMIFMSFALRAQRWRLLVEHQPPIRYWPSFSALMIGYFMNSVLPARAGDVARALELGRSEQMSRTKVFATLVTERTVDLVATLVLLSLVLLNYPALPEWLKKSGVAVATLAAGAGFMLVLAHTTGRRWITPLVGRVAHYLPKKIGSKLDQMVLSALEGIAGMFRPTRAIGFILITALLWCIEVAIVYIVAVSVGLPLAPGNALFVLLVLAIGSMIPSSPGFVGTYEFFGVSALGLIGLEGPSALAFIILLHILTLLGATSIGAVCLVLRQGTSQPLKDEVVS